eukprot:7164271-Prymnesium_polylepis.2
MVVVRRHVLDVERRHLRTAPHRRCGPGEGAARRTDGARARRAAARARAPRGRGSLRAAASTTGCGERAAGCTGARASVRRARNRKARPEAARRLPAGGRRELGRAGHTCEWWMRQGRQDRTAALSLTECVQIALAAHAVVPIVRLPPRRDVRHLRVAWRQGWGQRQCQFDANPRSPSVRRAMPCALREAAWAWPRGVRGVAPQPQRAAQRAGRAVPWRRLRTRVGRQHRAWPLKAVLARPLDEVEHARHTRVVVVAVEQLVERHDLLPEQPLC